MNAEQLIHLLKRLDPKTEVYTSKDEAGDIHIYPVETLTSLPGNRVVIE